MKACIVAVGSEMLTPFRVDTNSLFITERLNAIGYDVRLKAVVGDDVEELARLLERRADVGRPDRRHRRARSDRGRHHARRGRARARRAARRRRADRRSHPRAVRAPRPDDAGDQPAAGDGAARRDGAPEPERHGARACGWSTGGTAIVLLPGPPREMKPMLECGHSRTGSRRRRGGAGLFRRVLKITGRDRIGRRRARRSRSTAGGRRRRCRSARRSSPSSARSSCT